MDVIILKVISNLNDSVKIGRINRSHAREIFPLLPLGIALPHPYNAIKALPGLSAPPAILSAGTFGAVGPEGCSSAPNPALHACCTRWGVQGTGHRALNLCFATPCWKAPKTSIPRRSVTPRGSPGAPPPQTPSSSSPKSPGVLLHPQHRGRRWYPMGSGCPAAGIPCNVVHTDVTTAPRVPRRVGMEQLLPYNSPRRGSQPPRPRTAGISHPPPLLLLAGPCQQTQRDVTNH